MVSLSARRQHRRIYQEFKAKGICVMCHNKEATKGVHCPKCSKKNNKQNVTYRLKTRRQYKKNGCAACDY